ncbi:hypothetical protein MXG66_001740 [Salmonella enterica]|nr:hypothetical protein [Salmonella enterica]EJB9177017.1 hypothetical protein [Salmonella enterica]EJC0017675.1 hypothetical protein [Salmonella enterica]
MNMIHKYAISGTIIISTMTAYAKPIDPEILSSETTVMTPVTITQSATAPEVHWHPENSLKDDILDGETVGNLEIIPMLQSRACIKTNDADCGYYLVSTEDKQHNMLLSIKNGERQEVALLLQNYFDTEACTKGRHKTVTLRVAKVGDKMNRGVYNGQIYVATMYD